MLKFLNYDVFMSLKIVFICAISADPDEMPPYAAFHLGLHYLPRYLFTGVQKVLFVLLLYISVTKFSVMSGRFPVFLG